MKARLAGPGGLRGWFRYRGLLVLVLWQVPVQPVIRPNGSLGFMIAGGSGEQAQLSCDGSVISSDRVGYRAAALEADYDLSPTVRVEAGAGVAGSDYGSHRGGFGGLRLRADWRGFGLGGGFAVAPGTDDYDADSSIWPSVYLRVGGAQGAHFRADVFPTSALAAQHVVRIGAGVNAVDRSRVSGFVGLAGIGLGEGASGVAGELTVPMSSGFALRAEGHYAAGEERDVYGMAVGGRFLLGGARLPAQASRTGGRL